MAKQIKVEFEGTVYTLEYSRRTIREMESEGFNQNELDSKPMTMIPMMIAGAFKMHHRLLKSEVIDRIYADIPDKSGFVAALAQIYSAPLNALMEEPGEGLGNAKWETIG